jgi:biotin carboxylase
VITADYLPNNPGHKLSDEYHNTSTTDKNAILNLAIKLKIDGILSYASDPGAPTAAYVAEKLGLPGNPYSSVKILQNKKLFRDFLKREGFNVPEAESFNSLEKSKEYADYLIKKYTNIIVKPVDASGSKGVTQISDINDFGKAFEHAIKYSISKDVIIEQFIRKNNYEMDGDGFIKNKKLAFRCFGNQHNDLEANPFVPVGISFPYVQDEVVQKNAHNEIEKILQILGMRIGGINIEFITDSNNNIYILEIGPRNGGNLIPEVIKLATNIDLIAASIESALDNDVKNIAMTAPKGYYSSYIIHSKQDGFLKEVKINNEIKDKIIKKSIYQKKGAKVKKFNGSNDTIGAMILKFTNLDEMLYYLDNMNKYIETIVD